MRETSDLDRYLDQINSSARLIHDHPADGRANRSDDNDHAASKPGFGSPEEVKSARLKLQEGIMQLQRISVSPTELWEQMTLNVSFPLRRHAHRQADSRLC